MGMEFLLYGGILLAGFAVLWTVYTIFAVNEDSKALSWATGDQPDKSESPIINWSRPLVHQLTIKYAKRIKNETFRKNIEYKIMTGGLENELNVDEFIGLKILWGIFFPILLAILNATLSLGYPWFIFVIAPPLGWMIPDMHANKMRKDRYQKIIIDLPFFVDLLALSTQAGADFMGAIQKISDAAETVCSPKNSTKFYVTLDWEALESKHSRPCLFAWIFLRFLALLMFSLMPTALAQVSVMFSKNSPSRCV
jgi:tight adherence protein C